MNESIFFFLNNFSHQFVFLDNIIIFFAVYFPYLVIITAFIFILMHHEVFREESTWQVFLEKKKEILSAFFTGLLAWFLAFIFKPFFHTGRPFEILKNINFLFFPTDYTFPSGHATFFLALALSIFFFHKKAGYVFMFFALVIGLARIVAGVHFPSDVFSGYVLGFIVAYIINKIRT